MEKEYLKYIKDGISIDGNPTDGYSVFTIPTQRFKISSLDELNVLRFEKAIDDLKKREELENQLLREIEPVQHDLDWRGFIEDKYDITPNKVIKCSNRCPINTDVTIATPLCKECFNNLNVQYIYDEHGRIDNTIITCKKLGKII